MGRDHGAIFQAEDRLRRQSDQIDYEYYSENPDDDTLSNHEASFARSLSRIIPRESPNKPSVMRESPQHLIRAAHEPDELFRL
ncbi:HEPN/Toprim-associated domain-containing protein [Pseudomonas putida]